MIPRPADLARLKSALKRSPVTALLGPRQSGKTTLARLLAGQGKAAYFDLESRQDASRLQNPELALAAMKGLVVLDEIQAVPELFNTLRVLADRPGLKTRFLILGSASPTLIKSVSQSLAGRVEFVELSGFTLMETGAGTLEKRWLRGGFPRSFLARSLSDSMAWREGFIRTFLERDIPQLGITISSPALRRFWTMLAHYHAQVWNASEIAASLGLTNKTTRAYLDILTGTYMTRQLQPWHENLKKRQVKAPKIYLRDCGVLHSLLGLSDMQSLLGHPKAGASWEGFALEEVLCLLNPSQAYFWATHNQAELDLFIISGGKRFGFEFKISEAPRITPSMRIALNDLGLDHLWIVYPGSQRFPVHEKITAVPLTEINSIRNHISK